MAHVPAAHRITLALSDEAYTAARLVAARRAAGSVSLILEELIEVCFSRPDPARRVTITLQYNPAYWPKDKWQKILEGIGARVPPPVFTQRLWGKVYAWYQWALRTEDGKRKYSLEESQLVTEVKEMVGTPVSGTKS